MYSRNSIVIALCLLLLSGCGFKLRGAQKFPPQYQYAQIQGTAEFSPLSSTLKQYLGSANIKPAVSATAADLILIVRRDEFTRRVLSVNTGGAANEYEIRYNLEMDAKDSQGKTLVDGMKVSLVRTYSFDPNNVLAKTDEETVIRNQMRQLAVQQVLRQLSVRLTRLEAAPPASSSQPDNQPAAESPVETTL